MLERDLYDLRDSDSLFSWRGVRYKHLIHCCFDRALSNSVLAEMFPSERCEYLCFEGSYHRHIVSYFKPTKRKKRGLFINNRRLNNNEQVAEIGKNTWTSAISFQVEQRIN